MALQQRKIIATTVLFAFLAILAGCKAVQDPLENTDVLSGDQKDAVIAAADPLGQSVLDGLANDDYATFSTYFTDDVKSGWAESTYATFRQDLTAELGAYQSNQINSVLQNDRYSTVVYTLAFDSGKTVNMRLILSLTQPYQITGLWFDSPELVQ